MSKTPTFRIWAGMKSRCYDSNSRIYKYYGGRGIKVCDRWRDSFMNFYNDMGLFKKGLQLDRINNDGDYEPSNCRWVTPLENNSAYKGDLKDDMPGKTFGKWKVLKRVQFKKGHRYYICMCNCGTILIVCGGDLRRGSTTQCIRCKHREHSIKHKDWHKRKRLAQENV